LFIRDFCLPKGTVGSARHIVTILISCRRYQYTGLPLPLSSRYWLLFLVSMCYGKLPIGLCPLCVFIRYKGKLTNDAKWSKRIDYIYIYGLLLVKEADIL